MFDKNQKTNLSTCTYSLPSGCTIAFDISAFLHILLWFFKCCDWIKPFPQKHLKGRSPAWLRRCVFKCDFWRKLFWQISQEKGFSPVWHRSCSTRFAKVKIISSILFKNFNFVQQFLFCSKISILFKDFNFVQKFQFCSKISILFKNFNFNVLNLFLWINKNGRENIGPVKTPFFYKRPNFCTKFDPPNDFSVQRYSYHFKA